jgi:hypothetical protein
VLSANHPRARYSALVDFFRRLAHAYGNLGFSVKAAIVVGLGLVTTAIGVAMVVWIPADHFKSVRPQSASWWRSQPVVRGSVLVSKNALGVVLVALGVVMAVPLVPGPGLVFILMGFSLLDFPGKRNVERRLLGVPHVIRFLNEVRRRFGRPPLVLEPPQSRRQLRDSVEEKR